jgi:hypothetical protein
VRAFALWLSTTSPSVFIQEHNAWTIPAIQSVHIVGIALVMGSVLMLNLRVLGLAWTDQTLRQTTSRFGPWLTGSLWLLLATGGLMVVGEPVRELVTLSFWLKMALVVVGTLMAVTFHRSLQRQERRWEEAEEEAEEEARLRAPSTKALAVLTLLIWAAIIVLGRLIAYDHVWGAWAPSAG